MKSTKKLTKKINEGKRNVNQNLINRLSKNDFPSKTLKGVKKHESTMIYLAVLC